MLVRKPNEWILRGNNKVPSATDAPGSGNQPWINLFFCQSLMQNQVRIERNEQDQIDLQYSCPELMDVDY